MIWAAVLLELGVGPAQLAQRLRGDNAGARAPAGRAAAGPERPGRAAPSPATHPRPCGAAAAGPPATAVPVRVAARAARSRAGPPARPPVGAPVDGLGSRSRPWSRAASAISRTWSCDHRAMSRATWNTSWSTWCRSATVSSARARLFSERCSSPPAPGAVCLHIAAPSLFESPRPARRGARAAGDHPVVGRHVAGDRSGRGRRRGRSRLPFGTPALDAGHGGDRGLEDGLLGRRVPVGDRQLVGGAVVHRRARGRPGCPSSRSGTAGTPRRPGCR